MAAAKRLKPNSSHFKPGTSGNPAGRPRKTAEPKAPAVNMDLILREGARLVTVEQNGVATTIDMETLTARALYGKAAKGDARALKLVIEQQAQAKKEREGMYLRLMTSAQNHKDGANAAIARAKKHGRRPPDIVPHPDDIVVDYQRIGISVRGPWTKEQRDARKKLRDLRTQFQEALRWDEAHPTAGRDDPEYVAAVAHLTNMLDSIDRMLPELERWEHFLLHPFEE